MSRIDFIRHNLTRIRAEDLRAYIEERLTEHERKLKEDEC
jgi:hypothetical protein